MTNNEIIKALEALREEQENGYVTALEFGGKRDETHEGFLDLLGATVDLISRQKAEIERLEKELQITREYIHDNGLELDLLSKNKKAKSKCDCYHTITKRKYTYNPITGQPIGNDIEVGVCWGTKECEECSCKGDESKCDFYSKKRRGR